MGRELEMTMQAAPHTDATPLSSASKQVDPAVAYKVFQLVSEYFLRTDRPDFGDVAELFLPEATLELGAMTLTGLSAISSFFNERNVKQAESGRFTRHLCGPLTLRATSPDRMQIHAVVAVFAASGDLPLPSAPPSTIVDFDDLCERDAAGTWRFARRKATLIFTGAAAPAFAK